MGEIETLGPSMSLTGLDATPAITAEIQVIVGHVQAMKIDSPEAMESAADVLTYIKDKIKAVEEERKGLVKPLNDHVKMINARFKTYTAPLSEAEATLKGKVALYLSSGEAEKKAHGSYGSIHTRESWTYEVEDISKVPLAFLTVDDARVKQAIADGRREIDGLKIYSKDTVVSR